MKKVLFVAAFCAAVTLMAQQPPLPPEQQGGEGKPGAEMQRPDNRENFQALVIERVKKELDLTPEQAGKYVELFFKGEEVRQQINKKKAETSGKIAEAMKAEKVDEGALNGLVEEYNKLDRELADKAREFKEKGSSMLNTVQKAKLVLMEGRMMRGMQGMGGQNRDGQKRPERKEGERKGDQQ